jgi:MerR family transcriptional regulator, repressor of the yfmOP operon
MFHKKSLNMTTVNFQIPALQVILDKLEVIDGRILSMLNEGSQNNMWLTSKEAAKALRVTTRTLQSYRDQGLIPFTQFGREVRYRAEDVQFFLMDHYVKTRKQEGGQS